MQNRRALGRVAAVASLAVLSLAIVVSPSYAVDSFVRIDTGVGSSPKGIAITPDGSLILIALQDADTVRVLDSVTNHLITDIPVGNAPIDIAISPDGAIAYVLASVDDAVNIIDIDTLTVIGSPIPAGDFPYDVEFSPDGLSAYVTNYLASSIVEIDVATSTVTTTTPSGVSNPQGLAVSPDGTTLWYVAGSTVQSFNTATWAAGSGVSIGDINFPAAQARVTDISPDGATLAVVGDNSPKVYFIDTSSETVVDSIDVGSSAYAIQYSADGARLYVGLSAAGGVSIIDIATGVVIDTTATESAEVGGIALSPGGDFGYASNSDDGSVTLFGDPVNRTSGTDRYKTAVAVSQASYPAGAGIVFVATGGNFPDALSAGPAAAHLGGPLLLTASNSLPAAVKAEIQRLNPELIVLIGGTGVVSTAVEVELQALAPGGVTRLGGANRYETSRNLVRDAFLADGATDVYLATGRNFPDALGAAAVGAGFGRPVILVDGNASTVDAPTLQLLADLGVQKIRIAGGTGVVSQGIADQLASEAFEVVRLGGTTRYETSFEINHDGYPLPGAAIRVFLATGVNFPDALAGSAWAGHVHAPLFIVPGTCVPTDILTEIIELGGYKVTLIGGTGVLTQSVFDLTECA